MPVQDRLREGISLLDIRLFEIGGVPITLVTLLSFFAVIILTAWLSSFIRRAVKHVFHSRGVTDEGTTGVALSLIHYLVLVIGFGIALNTLGFNLTGLFAAGALFAVGIGFAMQNMVENFVSGVILLLERVIKPGDVLEVGDQMIRVREMGMRATVARTLDDENVIIPNAQLVQSQVKNFTFRDNLYRIRVDVGVTYSSDMKLVRSTLESTAANLKWPSKEIRPLVRMKQFGSSSVDFELSIWMNNPWGYQQRKSDVHEAIWFAFKEAGIVIAFPQVDVHLDGKVEESLQALRAV